MFIGHFAVGFAAKRWAPRQNLAVLIAAPIFDDILWPILVALGVERFHIAPGNTAYQPAVFDWYPWSHSLLLDAAWAVLIGWVVWRFTRDVRGAWIVGALVVSHWVLDWISHVPDMPLWPGGPRVGLGLWNSIAATVTVEGALFVAGVAVYLVSTRATDRRGTIALWSLLVVLVASYAVSSNGAPPPSQAAVIAAGMAATVFMPLWAWWIDRHREMRSAAPAVAP